MDYVSYIKSLPKNTALNVILRNNDVLEFVKLQYPDIDDISKCISAIRRNLTPYCAQCNGIKKDIRKTTCSHSCSIIFLKSTGKYKEYVEKRTSTFVKTHGKGTLNAKKRAEKSKHTRYLKYGNYSSVDGEITKRNNMKKLNAILPDILFKKYGVINVSQLDEVKKKKKQTLYNNYGVSAPMLSSVIRNKTILTNISRYGVYHPMKSADVKHRQIDAFFIRYGTLKPNIQHILPENYEKLYNIEFLINENKTKTCQQIAHELGVTKSVVCKVFNLHNIKVKLHQSSFFEHQVKEYIRTFCSTIIENDRQQIKPYELDIYLPELNIAIECNGRYYHQDQEKENRKYQLCKEKGISLFFVWDDEWYGNTEEIKERIKYYIFS